MEFHFYWMPHISFVIFIAFLLNALSLPNLSSVLTGVIYISILSEIQSVIKFLPFVTILIWTYLRFSWSYISLQLSYLWTVKSFSDRQKGREGWSQCLRELKIDPGTVTGPAMWSGGRTSLTSDDDAVSGDGKCHGFHKLPKCDAGEVAAIPLPYYPHENDIPCVCSAF